MMYKQVMYQEYPMDKHDISKIYHYKKGTEQTHFYFVYTIYMDVYTYVTGGCCLAWLAACPDTLSNCCFSNIMSIPGAESCPRPSIYIVYHKVLVIVWKQLRQHFTIFYFVYQNILDCIYIVYTVYIHCICMVYLQHIHCNWKVYW